jgi:serine/threonine protein kinase
MSKENDSLIGKQLGAYQVQSSLGEGGMARVYKAYHPRLRREVAIKVILAEIADRAGFQVRFEREAQMVASLEHPNIVSIYDFASEGHLTYLVMQYVGGGTLREQLRGKRPLEPQRAAYYAIQMARALHHAHQRGIIHRDVKPQNMLVSSTNGNHLLLSDFGIAKIYQGGEDSTLSQMPTRERSDSSLTNVDQVIGTADYMSPEQARGKAVDARTDVYALGVVLFQMLTGEVPFHSTTLQGLLFQHVYTPPPSVREKNPHVPEVLAQITARALAKTPEERFQSAEAMAQALDLANVNATNPLASFAQSNLTYPQSNPAGFYLANTPQQWSRPGSSNAQDSYATHSDAQTAPGSLRVTSPSTTPLPTTSPGITGTQLAGTGKRPLSLSTLLTALALIVCLVVAGVRFLPGIMGGSPGTTTNIGAAQGFTEHFQNNNLGWQTGAMDQGISATLPSGGQYSVTVAPNQTALPYPQNAGTLPNIFTLTATIQESTGGATTFYGVVIHFSQGAQGTNGYAFVINNSGQCQIIKYMSATSTPSASAQCSYSASGQTGHTIKVQAHSNNYAFFVDNKAILLPTSSNSTNTVWNDNSLSGGKPALLLAGPADSTNTHATYVASLVALTIP